MKVRICISRGFFLFLLVQGVLLFAQDKRAQYPSVLSNSYVDLDIGYIGYTFSNEQLESGFQAASVQVPHTAVKLVLFGHRFNEYLAAQVIYMRPVSWVEYKNVNGDQSSHSVWMNVAGLTLRSQFPVSKKFSWYGEGGVGVITRRGFSINGIKALTDANYVSSIIGTGVAYHLNSKWDLHLEGVSSPVRKKVKQPSTLFISGGFMYTMRPLPRETVKRNSTGKYIFPHNLLQVGYTTNTLGYGVNNVVSKGPVPVFWGGEAKVARGISVHYQRNIFHSRRVFFFDWGASISYWKSKKNKNSFYTLSLFPLLRFTAWRTKQADLYFNYSVAGPTYISRTIIDDEDTGKHFSFQDFMGMGIFTGKKRSLNVELRIAHYSNGNIFPQNTGVMIPLTFNLGYAF
jgi:Lipid A 3-O-deacylase (PagL)/Outer membrane protein beta-barrel domain